MTRAMDELQTNVRPFLKELRWRARARAFNRTTLDGLTQVIEFQLGRFGPPGTHYVGLRRNVYGKSTVNVGAYVPEVDKYTSPGVGVPSFVHGHDCCIRERLGKLGPEHEDMWWTLGVPYDGAAEVCHRIERDALPFLARFETRDALLNQWTLDTPNPYTGGKPPRIVCAIILAVRGRRDEARSFLVAQAREHRNHPHFAFVCALADKLGLGELEL